MRQISRENGERVSMDTDSIALEELESWAENHVLPGDTIRIIDPDVEEDEVVAKVEFDG